MLHICTHTHTRARARTYTPIAQICREHISDVVFSLKSYIYVTQLAILLDDEDIIFPFERRSSSIKYVEASLRLKLDAEYISIENINSIVQICCCIIQVALIERDKECVRVSGYYQCCALISVRRDVISYWPKVSH